jgi:hypothetical protein
MTVLVLFNKMKNQIYSVLFFSMPTKISNVPIKNSFIYLFSGETKQNYSGQRDLESIGAGEAIGCFFLA